MSVVVQSAQSASLAPAAAEQGSPALTSDLHSISGMLKEWLEQKRRNKQVGRHTLMDRQNVTAQFTA